ncbi:leucine efflux protein LeuE [Planomonospora sp. ID91781]|uniref:Leucine export protein LeuE n=1 Tax=Planomonospora sphaerica TaxID=161355 RepID=A0A161LJ64_9ACTN|nr:MULTISPECIES: leucine efflux protein LeuE [Planomonospora]MBG0821406.1 leucine efflux protein LeuE [Planomonospora sp. ID91781]GAT65637.1 leucine export protein LeuE [Planomonospora sphaerica]
MFFGITDLWTYVAGAFFIILLPGPNSLYVLATAARHGVAQGYRGAAGVFVGDTVLMALAAAGAASVLKTTPLLFAVVKYAGAAYLAWMGLQMLRGAWRSRRAPESVQAEETAQAVAEAERGADPFRRALVVSLLNPKAILFFISFFIQFVDPAYSSPALSFLVLGAILQVFSMLYLTALIFGGTYLAAQFRRRRRLAATLTAVAGVLFVGFGARLATASLG